MHKKYTVVRKKKRPFYTIYLAKLSEKGTMHFPGSFHTIYVRSISLSGCLHTKIVQNTEIRNTNS